MNVFRFSIRVVSKLYTPVRSNSCKPPPSYVGKLSFHHAFGKHLLLTNTISSAVLMIIGDIWEQEIEFRKKVISKRYDWGRVGRMFVTGLLFGPLHHYFYAWLDKRIPQRHLKAIGQKILWDQAIMSPACIATLFYSVGIMEGRTFREIGNEIQEKFLDIYKIDWCIWVPTQFINFYFVPVKYQVVYINGVTMGYNVFLSYMKHKSSAPEKEE